MFASKQIMRLRPTRVFALFNPFLQVTFLFIFSLLMAVLNIKENPVLLKTRAVTADYIHHLMTLSARPFVSLIHFHQEWHTLIKAKEENKELHRTLAEFQNLHYASRVLMAENKKLREALKALPPAYPVFLTARIHKVMTPQGGSHLILEAGLDQGIIKDQAVMVKGYLIGRVIEVYAKTSRILPLTDPLSRIPVILELSNLKAILAGHPRGQLVLTHREENSSIISGELALSSGEGGLFPAGLPLGVIEKSSQGEWRVSPLFSLKDLTFGHVLTLSPLVPLIKEMNEETQVKSPPNLRAPQASSVSRDKDPS